MLLVARMKKGAAILFLIFSVFGHAQTENPWKKNAFVLSPEILFGRTMKANEGFPETGMQKQLVLNFGRDHTHNPQQWARALKNPKTGLSIGITDFGNRDGLGIALTTTSFIEFKMFGSERLKMLTAIGASYFTEKYDPHTNPSNRAVTTHFSWAFRMFFYYHLFSANNTDWRLGLGYSHHSNGHTRLMNQGFNSFLVALSADIKDPTRYSEKDNTKPNPPSQKTTHDYFAFHGGLGQHVFAMAYNYNKSVYVFAGEYGRVYDRTFKIGIGFYSRFYQHYYNYITDEGSLVQEGREYAYFKKDAWFYATNFGLSLNGEIFLNHFGIDLQLGLNLHKPAYKMEYRINEGWKDTPREIPENWMLGELDTEYKIKHRISSRIGLKYYLIGMEKAPKHNFYIGGHVNTNLGQADFSELSFGYVHGFNR